MFHLLQSQAQQDDLAPPPPPQLQSKHGVGLNKINSSREGECALFPNQAMSVSLEVIGRIKKDKIKRERQGLPWWSRG